MTSDELWLFSACELCGQIDWQQPYNSVLNAEGQEYKLFRDMIVDSSNGNAILTKTFKGGPRVWWQRSPYPFYSVDCLFVSSDGRPGNGDNANNTLAVVPGFCI